MKKPLFNPLKTPFKVWYDVYGNAQPVTYEIPPFEVMFFDTNVFEHIKTHLLTKVLNKKGTAKNWERIIQLYDTTDL